MSSVGGATRRCALAAFEWAIASPRTESGALAGDRNTAEVRERERLFLEHCAWMKGMDCHATGSAADLKRVITRVRKHVWHHMPEGRKKELKATRRRPILGLVCGMRLVARQRSFFFGGAKVSPGKLNAVAKLLPAGVLNAWCLLSNGAGKGRDLLYAGVLCGRKEVRPASESAGHLNLFWGSSRTCQRQSRKGCG